MLGKFVNVLVDETPIKVGLGHTIMQTCASAGIEIPRFCYHDKLLIAGNCRICLVEIAGSKKLVAACAVHATNNMTIYSNTVRVRLARQNVLEFLLANHPLDCPICDQGGECDLQDITAVFGADRGRFYETEKRSVLNKDFGPLIRTSMNRCIHCTRCVRFLAMSSGVSVLGTIGRGSSTEISTYVGQFIDDELSGNITDLCPVGALTSKPYSFKARPWELTSVEGFDILDTLQSHVFFDISANRISRVLPYANEMLNECWLTNRARYAYDGLFVQRIANCLLRISLNTISSTIKSRMSYEFYIKLPWSAAILILLEKLTSPSIDRFVAGLGDTFDLESSLAAKFFFESIGASVVLADRIMPTNFDFNFLYLFNTSLIKLSKLPSFCLLVGVNLRLEAPLLNLRLSKLVSGYNTPVYRIGSSVTYLSFKSKYLSQSVDSLFKIVEFKHPFCKNFYLTQFSTFPLILLGQSIVTKFGESCVVAAVLDFLRQITSSAPGNFSFSKHFLFNNFGILNTYSARIHAADVGFGLGVSCVQPFPAFDYSTKKKYLSRFSLFYSLGFDNVAVRSSLETLGWNRAVWTVYQGTHGQGVASSAQLVLPIFTYVESTTVYKNLLGSVKKSNVAVSYNFGAKTNTEIFKLLLTEIANQPLFKFSSLNFWLSATFNWNLLRAHEMLLSSAFLMPWTAAFDAVAGTNLLPLTNKNYYYVCTYRAFFIIKNNLIGGSAIYNFYSHLISSVLTKGVRGVIASSVLTYYGDPNLILLSASKTMNMCSNLALKKNLSFSSFYY